MSNSAIVDTIVCPYDFTDFCREGLEVALATARAFDADLHILHVVVVPVPGKVTRGEHLVEAERRMVERLTHERWPAIDAVVQALGGQDVRVRVAVREGFHASLAIREYAEVTDANLIVMASHGRRGLARFFLGSTTERVLRAAPCPVLIVRPKEERQRDRLTDVGDGDPQVP